MGINKLMEYEYKNNIWIVDNVFHHRAGRTTEPAGPFPHQKS
jgi:hypothetical protein